MVPHERTKIIARRSTLVGVTANFSPSSNPRTIDYVRQIVAHTPIEKRIPRLQRAFGFSGPLAALRHARPQRLAGLAGIHLSDLLVEWAILPHA